MNRSSAILLACASVLQLSINTGCANSQTEAAKEQPRAAKQEAGSKAEGYAVGELMKYDDVHTSCSDSGTTCAGKFAARPAPSRLASGAAGAGDGGSSSSGGSRTGEAKQ
jgi:hypothetical protein